MVWSWFPQNFFFDFVMRFVAKLTKNCIRGAGRSLYKFFCISQLYFVGILCGVLFCFPEFEVQLDMLRSFLLPVSMYIEMANLF